VHAEDFQETLRRLNDRSAVLQQENDAKAARLEALAQEIAARDRSSGQHRHELEQAKLELRTVEEQSAITSRRLTAASSQLESAKSQVAELLRTVSFLKEVFQALAQDHDADEFSRTLATWLCDAFGLERCSVMELDAAGETLHITAHRGIDAALVPQVKVRVGQGIAGWVALHRRPLFVRAKEDAREVGHPGQTTYNSDSFICVPVVFKDRLFGVLNLSNKRDGAPFNELDLDRALLAGSVLAAAYASRPAASRAAA
jgi:transcriptional regulator with GAF, ATPase, and Fis domain